MNKKLQDGRFRIVSSLLAFCLLIGVAWCISVQASTLDFMETGNVGTQDSGTLEKMIVANGKVAMEIDMNRLNGAAASTRKSTLNFDAVQDTFFAILVINGEFRGPVPSSMEISPRGNANLPASLRASYKQLVLEYLPWGGNYEMAIRDSKTGFTFFNIEGEEWNYDSNQHTLGIQSARLLISPEFAAQLGRSADAGVVIGNLSLNTSMRTVEMVQLDQGEATQSVLPPMNRPEAGTVPGPDVIVGDLSGLAQFGSSSGTQVGLAVGTDSCNFGTVDLHWFQNPANDHPVIPQNLYRMSGGVNNNDRFEQVGQSNVKHAFTALTNNICSLGCNGVGGANLGSGCSDPYGAGLNSGPSLGSRAWINPFTGAYPRNDGSTPNNDHTGHTHTGPSHRILVEIADLSTTNNPGATYFTESQYITPHEYVWCQADESQSMRTRREHGVLKVIRAVAGDELIVGKVANDSLLGIQLADAVQTLNEASGRSNVRESRLPDSCNHAGNGGDKRAIGDLHARLTQWAAGRAEQVGDDIHHSPLHAAGEHFTEHFLHVGRVRPAVARAGFGLGATAQQSPRRFGARRLQVGQKRSWMPLRIERQQRAVAQQELLQIGAFADRAGTPMDDRRSREMCDAINPSGQSAMNRETLYEPSRVHEGHPRDDEPN